MISSSTEAEQFAKDPRVALLDMAIRGMQGSQDALIEILHRAQNLFGRLSPDILMHVARGLRLPPSKVQGVATFYHLFHFSPKGKHNCVVCVGTACHLFGGEKLLKAAEATVGIKAGQTTVDGEIALGTVRCTGTCGLAPLVLMDGEVQGHQRPEEVVRQLKGWSRRDT